MTDKNVSHALAQHYYKYDHGTSVKDKAKSKLLPKKRNPWRTK